MTLNEYQGLAERTVNKKLTWQEMRAHALHGLVAEVGEIHSIYQKAYQGHTIDFEQLKEEIGDLLWFVAELCDTLGVKMDDVAARNIEKLRKRYPEGFDEERSRNRERQ